MELDEFTAAVPGFALLSHPDKILHFGWFLHTHRNKEYFDQAAIRSCYKKLSMQEPNFSDQFTRLINKRPKVLLKEASGYRLEHAIRRKLDKKYGEHETTIAVSQMMKDLIGKVSDQSEKLFLSEAMKCYHIKAFRAAIVMAWNLAYDHLLTWIVADPTRLANFNAKIIGRIGQKRGNGLVIAKREDFEDLKEQEVLDICGTGGLFASGNTKTILDMQITKRNLAAHPSLIIIDAPQADDAISSLVNNVVLVLK
jgi:hypothetical protein